MAFPSMLRKRRFLFIVLLAFVLISSGIVVVWQQSATTWRQQQDFLNQQVQAVAPDAVLFVIRAQGTWTPFGIYDLSVEAHYVQPTGEQIFATFSSTVYDTDRRIEWEPPAGSGPISSSWLNHARQVQQEIQVGPGDALRIAHGAIMQFTLQQRQSCRITSAGLIIDRSSANWVVMCSIAPHSLAVIIDPYTGAILQQSSN